jgi:hypothetical protein
MRFIEWPVLDEVSFGGDGSYIARAASIKRAMLNPIISLGVPTTI